MFICLMPLFGKRVYARSAVVERPERPLKRRMTMNATGSHPVSLRNPNSFKTRLNRRQPLRKQLLQLQKNLNLNAPEFKYKDVDLTVANITLPGDISNMLEVAQGDGVGDRAGNTIRLKSVSCKGKINSEAYAGFSPDTMMRFVIIRDKQQDFGTVPGIVDIFTPSDPFQLFMDVQFLDRYEIKHLSGIYYPRRFQQGAGFVPTQTPYFEFNWKGDMEVHYASSLDSSIQKNGWYFCILTSDTTGSGIVDFVGNARIGFIDA